MKRKSFETFSLRKQFIDYPQAAAAVDRLAAVHQDAKRTGLGRGLALLGPSGVGKTTALMEYENRYLADYEFPGNRQPIVFVVVPSTPTPKSLGSATLAAMGDPLAHVTRHSAEERQARIVTLFEKLGTELVIFDEAQHMVDHRKASREAVSDWLKNLLNVTGVAVVIAGLKRTENLLAANEQLRRRFSATSYYDRFSLDTQEDALAFVNLLVSFRDNLPVAALDFTEKSILMRFYFASFGLIDYLIKVIDRAVQIARDKRPAEIDLDILARAFRDEIWSRAPDVRNPFDRKFDGQPLIGHGEPFERFDQIAI